MNDFLAHIAKSIQTAESDNSDEFEALRRAYLELRAKPPSSPQLELLKEPPCTNTR